MLSPVRANGRATNPAPSQVEARPVGRRRARVRLTWAQLSHILSFEEPRSPPPLTWAAVSPTARLAREWTRAGVRLSPRARLQLRAREAGTRDHTPYVALEGIPMAVQRCLDMSGARVPIDVALLQWWIQRDPPVPLALHATLLQGRMQLDTALCEHLCLLDISSGGLLEVRAPSTPLGKLRVASFSGCAKLLFLPDLRGAAQLRRVDLSESAVMDISGLAAGVCLEEIDVSGCQNLTSLSGLAELRHLRAVTAHRSGLADLSALRRCVTLTDLGLSECAALRDVSPLAGCTSLQRLNLSATAVDDLAPLTACRELEELVVSECARLTTYPALPSLELLEARGSGISHLSTADGTPALVRAMLNECRHLRQLRELAGAASLRVISATFSAVSSLAGLATCAQLEELDLDSCIFLTSLDGLAGAPRLRNVSLAYSAVTSVDCLASCRALESLNVSSCAQLRSVAALSGHQSLRGLTAQRTPIAEVMRDCHALVALDVSGCPGLTDLSSLATGSPHLEFIDASYTGVRRVEFLLALHRLTQVRFDGCPLEDPAVLAAVRARTGAPGHGLNTDKPV